MNSPARELAAGVVVLYNPDRRVLENIHSYLGQIGRLYAIDNSETANPDVVTLLATTPGVVYHANAGNLGVARALNIGAERALADGYRFLLTMDQDSRAEPDMVERLMQCAEEHDGAVGIIAPFLVKKPGDAPRTDVSCERVLTAMTSGSLLSLVAYRAVGPFRNDYFIDFVDNEYCLRLNGRGFGVCRANAAVLNHNVGALLEVSLGGTSFTLTSHAPLRKYYKTRNRLYLAVSYFRAFPGYCMGDLLRFWGELGRLLLFEERKREKLAMMGRGIGDFFRGRSGRYEDSHKKDR